MSLLRPGKVVSSFLFALGLALPAALGQEADKRPAKKATAPIARETYAVRGGAVKDLANALTQHFWAEPGFRVVPDAGSNVLLLSGPKPALEQASAVLREIDRPARAVHVEVILIELGKAASEAAGDGKELDRVEWAGPARDVTAKIRDLQKRGWIASVQRIQLTALERHSAQAQAHESRPYTTGLAFSSPFFGGGVSPSGARGAAGGRRGTPGGGGLRGGDGAFPGGSGTAQRMISYRDVGTSVQVTPEIGADGLVGLDLRVEDSRMRTAEDLTLATDEKGTNIPATEFVTSTLESRLKVGTGHVVLAQGTATTSKSWQAQKVVLVSAGTEEAGK